MADTLNVLKRYPCGCAELSGGYKWYCYPHLNELCKGQLQPPDDLPPTAPPREYLEDVFSDEPEVLADLLAKAGYED